VFSLTLAPCLSLSLPLSLSSSFFHSLFVSLSLSVSLSLFRFLSFVVSLSFSLFRFLSFVVSLSFSLPLSLSLSLSLALLLSFSLACVLSPRHSRFCLRFRPLTTLGTVTSAKSVLVFISLCSSFAFVFALALTPTDVSYITHFQDSKIRTRSITCETYGHGYESYQNVENKQI